MTDTTDLARFYRDTVLHHSQQPHNRGPLQRANQQGRSHNALCGDDITVYLRTGASGTIEQAAFDGRGCAIAVASASLLTDVVRGLDGAAATALAEQFATGLTSEAPPPPALAALAGVREYPARVRCALLPWQALAAALDQPPADAPAAPASP
jgi:nitrogen fixation NifU-like protein